MSTKIYEAWRWKRPLGINPILYQVETIMKNQMYKKAQKIMKDAGDGIAQHTVMMMCAKLTQFSSLSPYRGPQGDFSCDFSVWDWKRHYYMLPIGTPDNWDFAEIYKIDGMEDFRYWNNVDEPEDMTRREWNRRGHVWDTQYEDRDSIIKMVYHILDPYTPNMDLNSLFDPRWASEHDMKRLGLPTCWELTQKAAKERRAAKAKAVDAAKGKKT